MSDQVVKTLADLEQRALGNGQQPGTKKSLGLRTIPRVAITVEELKTAVAKNPDHPVAKVYAAAIKRLKGDKPVGIEAPDLLALLRNHDVVINRSAPLDGTHIVTKTVVDPDASEDPTPAPVAKSEPPKMAKPILGSPTT